MSEPRVPRSSPEGYEIQREIGHGATAVVYLAYDRKHDRPVALKVLRPTLALTPERFLAEIRLIAGVHHPHILPLFDSGMWGELPFFVMPFIAGDTLEERLEREGALPFADALRIAGEVADALDSAHARGIVHRDVKPANILLADDHAFVADFGISHVIDRASTAPRATGVGVAIGTPSYMSPEQAVGERELDGRSDIYSLGCVVFEMLAGVTPFAGDSLQEVVARRVVEPPPDIRLVRSAVSEPTARALLRAMATRPDDRFATAGEFVRALSAPAPPPHAGGARRRRYVTSGALVAVVAAALWAGARRTSEGRAALDRSTYAVFPFRHAGTVPNLWLDGEGSARLLHDAMARWQGIRLVDEMRVSDVWSRQQPRTVSDAIDAAVGLRAGTLAWGEVVGIGDSIEIRATTYVVANGTGATRQFVVRVARDAPELERAFSSLADSIVVGGTRARDGVATGTRNLLALEQFLDGRAAVDRFDLLAAARYFRVALQLDDTYAHAHLWLARTMAWSGDVEPSEWAGDAARAVAAPSLLTAREQLHAAALLDLALGQLPQACRRYRALIAADSLDFAAWFGLGDCNARDLIVVPDSRSPTGHVFRGSYHTAIRAYQRAIALVPSFHLAERGLAFQRLSKRVLFTEESRLRRGVGAPPDTLRYGAFPAWHRDTLAFYPVELAKAMMGVHRPPTERRAVVRGVETYRQLMVDWVRDFPTSADAQEGYALALESASSMTGAGMLPEALAAARRSALGTSDDDLRVPRTAMVVRLLLKMDSVAAARTLADSMLAAWPSPTPRQAGYLAGLAALTGRASRAAELLRRAAADSVHSPFTVPSRPGVELPTEVTAGGLELLSYTALGGPRDSMRSAFARASRVVDAWTAPADRPRVRQAIFRNTIGLADPPLSSLASLGYGPGADRILAMRIQLARGDTAAARRESDSLTSIAARYMPGTMGMDRMYHHAVILLALGDTAAATRTLDAGLTALPRARGMLLKAISQAASLPRAMALRAMLAARRDDRATLERWGRPAMLLWSDADPELRATLDELRARLSARR